MKKIFALLCCVCLTLTLLVGCGSDNNSEQSNQSVENPDSDDREENIANDLQQESEKNDFPVVKMPMSILEAAGLDENFNEWATNDKTVDGFIKLYGDPTNKTSDSYIFGNLGDGVIIHMNLYDKEKISYVEFSVNADDKQYSTSLDTMISAGVYKVSESGGYTAGDAYANFGDGRTLDDALSVLDGVLPKVSVWFNEKEPYYKAYWFVDKNGEAIFAFSADISCETGEIIEYETQNASAM